MKLELGKLIFPKLAPDLRRQRMRTVYLTASVCAGIGVAFFVLMIKLDHVGSI